MEYSKSVTKTDEEIYEISVLMVALRHKLFNLSGEYARCYPKGSPYRRRADIMMGHFEKCRSLFDDLLPVMASHDRCMENGIDYGIYGHAARKGKDFQEAACKLNLHDLAMQGVEELPRP